MCTCVYLQYLQFFCQFEHPLLKILTVVSQLVRIAEQGLYYLQQCFTGVRATGDVDSVHEACVWRVNTSGVSGAHKTVIQHATDMGSGGNVVLCATNTLATRFGQLLTPVMRDGWCRMSSCISEIFQFVLSSCYILTISKLLFLINATYSRQNRFNFTVKYLS